MLLWFGLASASTVVVIATPGLPFEAHTPLVQALRRAGADVDVIELPCAGDFPELITVVREGLERHGKTVVVAHGLGATLALLADAAVARYVLLGPVLGVPNTSLFLGSAPLVYGDGPRLLGGDVRQTCVAPGLSAAVASWVASGTVPVPLEAVGKPVWIGSGLLDELAPPEVLVPASRRLADRTLVRLGITHFDRRDYHHLDLLTDSVPIAAAVHAAVP